MSASTTVTLKILKTKKRLIAREKIGDKNCILSLPEATENVTFWIGAKCSTKRISKSGMAQFTY